MALGAGKVPRHYESVRGTAAVSLLRTQVGDATFLGHVPSQPLLPLRHCGLSRMDGHLTALPLPPALSYGHLLSSCTQQTDPTEMSDQSTQPPQPPSAWHETGSSCGGEQCSGTKPQQGCWGCSAQPFLITASEIMLK